MAKKMGDKDIWVRTFEVTEPKKHKKGFTVYKVVSTVFPKSFPEGCTKIKVWKRYNDFKKLHKDLELVFRQLYLKGNFPKFPKDTVFGRFDDGLIEERRKCALALLEFAASYSLLFANKIFVKFFESSYHPKDFMDETCSSSCINSEQQDSRNAEENEECGSCLIPERVWKDLEIHPADQRDDDRHSMSSFTCSSPDPVALNNETDSILNSSLLSTTDQLTVAGTSGISESPRVTTFSDTDSSQSVVVSHAKPNAFIPSPYTIQESKRNLGMVSSASFTDDFDLLLDDDTYAEDSHMSRLPNSVSCLSLNTAPLNKTLREPKDIEGISHCNKTEKKKQNGFGFFDFLPIFAKKQENKIENEKVLAESLTASYICEAAGHFAVANRYESNSEYISAFEAYKEGIQILLTGAQTDSDQKRRVMVRKKIENYLLKAETLKEKSLQGTEFCESDISNEQRVSSPKLSSSRKKLQGLVERDSLHEGGFVVIERNIMPSFIDELKVYKVVGCTFNNILVVVDTKAIGGPRCYAVKVFRKSASTLDPEKPTLIPFTVPFMVQMIKWFNTDDSIILVLQYAGGGRLIDFVKAYQTKHISPVIYKVSSSSDENRGCFTFDNHGTATLESSKNSINVSAKTNSLATGNYIESNSSSTEHQGDDIRGEMKRKPNLESEKENKSDSENKMEESKSETVTSPNYSDFKLDCEINNDGTNPNGGFNGSAEENGLPTSSIINQQGESIPFLSISSQNLETEELIENSKVLIQTVSRTLGLFDEERKEISQEDQKVNFLPQTCLTSESILATIAPLKINSSTSKNGIKSKPTDENQMAVTKPSKLVLSFSRHLEDTVFNGPTFTSFSNTREVNVGLDDEASPLKRMVPECCCKVWAAEIVIALEKLHDQGITYGDLDINNILLGESGHILLSYRALWNEVDKVPMWNEFSAPEVLACLGKTLWRVHPSADWWSLGAILFILITGQTLQDAHPEGIYPQTVISIPLTNSCSELITPSAKTILAELLQFSPTVRLGYYGAEEIKSHPFFEGFDWDSAVATISDGDVSLK